MNGWLHSLDESSEIFGHDDYSIILFSLISGRAIPLTVPFFYLISLFFSMVFFNYLSVLVGDDDDDDEEIGEMEGGFWGFHEQHLCMYILVLQ